MKQKFTVGDLVKVSPKSDQIYRIIWIDKDSPACQIEAKKANGGGWYSAQNFDTSLLIKA